MELPVLSPLLTFLVLLGILVLRYFIIASSFYLYCSRTRKKPIDDKPVTTHQMKRDVTWSVLSSVIFALSGTILILLWRSGNTQIYHEFSMYGYFYLPLSLLLLLFLHDTYFYWSHRLLHQKKLFQICHKVHHESVVPTAWTSFSFHPLEALLQAMILPLLAVLIPVHWTVLAVFLGLMTILGVLNHLGYELYPEFFEKKLGLISAHHHQFHHKRVHFNFGLYFTFWDKWMKTEGARS